MNDPIYFDCNATTPILPEVADAMRDTALRYGANPESQHTAGREARSVLEESREEIGSILGACMAGANSDQVIFTSGGTESNNLAILGLTRSFSPGHILVSAIEHPCIAEAAKQLKSTSWQIEHAPSNTDGVVSASKIAELIKPRTRLVSLMLANNETGVVQPVGEVSKLCADREIFMHTDASQAIGRMEINFTELGVTALSCTAHKFHGPLGIGALVLRHGVKINPIIFGGHQQAGIRPGTECVSLAVGMRTALECWQRDKAARIVQLRQHRDHFEKILLNQFPEAKVNGINSPRLPNTSNISFVGLDRQALIMAFDQAGLACSTGSACASGSSEASPVLLAMGLDESLIESSIRFSFGIATTDSEIEEATSRILKICKSLRST